MLRPRIQLITRGDDCGSTHSANLAILEAFRTGILRNTSIMVPCAAVEDAARMIADEQGLCCGLHCTITAEWDSVRWGPVLSPEQVPSLVDTQGHFFQTTRALHDNNPRLDEIMAELQAQLDRARALGFDIRYADQHMGFHWVTDGLDEAFDAWCARESLCCYRYYAYSLPKVGAAGDLVEQLMAQLDAAPAGQYLVIGHPAHDNEEMRALGHAGYPGSVVATEREWQRRMFTDPRILAYCQEKGVAPIRYDEALCVG